jgi:uncharacterized protein (DUF1800 family)
LPAFDDDTLRHLLRRTEFVARPQRLATLKALGTLEGAVDDVLSLHLNPALRPSRGPVAYFENFNGEDATGVYDAGWTQYSEAARWWIDYAARGTSAPKGPAPAPPEWRALQEKMVLFWHGHFVSSWSQIHLGVHLMWQLHGYRKLALGNVDQLAQAMAVSPAMLVYLSNAFNVAAEPNQNFARELMELFTLGVGNYTEDDVDAVARAWTGHNYAYERQSYIYLDGAHDHSRKTLFGTSADWDGPEVIDEILVNNPSKRAIAARFLARKLWEFFAYVGPEDAVLDAMSAVLLANEMNVGALMRAMLLREEFYSTRARTGLVRAPLEWIVAVAYHTNMRGADVNLIDVTNPEVGERQRRSELTGQLIFQPPNVSGWRPNEYWLTASGLSGRAQIAGVAADFVLSNSAATPLSFSGSVGEVVDRVAQYFGIGWPAASTTRAAIVDAFGSNGGSAFPGDGARDLLMLVMLSPECHLA